MSTVQRVLQASIVVVPALSLLAAFQARHSSPSAPDDGALAQGADVIVVTGMVRDQNGNGLAGASVALAGGNTAAQRTGTITATGGRYTLTLRDVTRGTTVSLVARRIGYNPVTQPVLLNADTVTVHFTLTTAMNELAMVTTAGAQGLVARTKIANATVSAPAPAMSRGDYASDARRLRTGERNLTDSSGPHRPDWNREQYDRIVDNPFLAVRANPRSTFSIDVDRAAYGNVRRFLTQGQTPPADAVRIEELVNYFPYSLAEPRGSDPIAITTEVAPAPWQTQHRLVRIALQARRIETAALPPNNLVFLIDVSGSMESPDKLPLVKQSLRLLVDQMREQDHVAIVVYAGNAGLVLPSTPGTDKARIAEAIDRLEAGGSTAGGAGIQLAYRIARENFKANGNNRVILATDGDFNIGASSDADMERLIESKRGEGTYLTVLGFGTGNYQDAKMKKLSKIGNGNYAYVDNLSEARKVLVHELGATLVTVANDVKLQVEFNPAVVQGYRLIGYEDRLLRDEDFADDKKDAGDIGAGHSVTALYEVVPVGVHGTATLRGVDSLRYSAVAPATTTTHALASEMMYVKLRYKHPGDSTSRLMTHVVPSGTLTSRPSDDFRFAASVASFGMLLRNSEHKGNATGAAVLELARGALGDDQGGYRAEFVRLVERWQEVTTGVAARR